MLRWAYGAVANASAAQITERRRELLGGRTADRALMDLYEEVAQLWRRLNEIGSKKSHLQGLRCLLPIHHDAYQHQCLHLLRQACLSSKQIQTSWSAIVTKWPLYEHGSMGGLRAYAPCYLIFHL